MLERTQRGYVDLTEWVVWYVEKLMAALDEADSLVSVTLNKSFFWQRNMGVSLSERQVTLSTTRSQLPPISRKPKCRRRTGLTVWWLCCGIKCLSGNVCLHWMPRGI